MGVVLPEAAERILFVQDFGRQNSAVNQLLLKRADRNFPERFALLRRRRRGEARRIPLVLHIGLHADERHAVAVCADAEAGNQNSFPVFRQQRAERHIGAVGLVFRRLQQEHRVEDKAVGVEVAAGDDDGVAVAAVGEEIHRLKLDFACDAAAFARVEHLGDVEMVCELVVRHGESGGGVHHVAVAGEGDNRC